MFMQVNSAGNIGRLFEISCFVVFLISSLLYCETESELLSKQTHKRGIFVSCTDGLTKPAFDEMLIFVHHRQSV